MVSSRIKTAALAGAVLGGSAVLASATFSAVAAHFARRVVTPPRVKLDNVHITDVQADTVTFKTNPDTLEPGRYGVWSGGGTCHAKVGAVLHHDEDAGLVTRELETVDFGNLKPGPGRWSAYYVQGDPWQAWGFDFHDILLRSRAGELPTWHIPAPNVGETGGTWAVAVHGHGATREECLRALPLLHRLGIPVVIPSYRNSREGPVSGSGRYMLGDTEWEDAEAAVVYALSQGAERVLCFGWSMGGAIVLQLASRSWTASRISGLVLDSPVVDWSTVLEHQAKINHIPRAIGNLGAHMLANAPMASWVGTNSPVPLDQMDWVKRAQELRVPSLIIHSDNDPTVPGGPSQELAKARADLVTYVDVENARHTRGWNVDSHLWETEVARFVLNHS